MREYDFRFPGVHYSNAPKENRLLRDTVLALAGGFTEIEPNDLTDLIPGEGAGYIVALETEREAFILQRRIRDLALGLALPAPSLYPGWRGPRRNYCFFLLPEFANPDSHGYRRRLFSPQRMDAIHHALKPRLSHPITRIYGEWKPQFAAAHFNSDISSMFVSPIRTSDDVEFFRTFIQQHIFDQGRECDQETIYLSVRGAASYVYPSQG